MLIWITKPTAALGIFALFVLLSAAFSQGITLAFHETTIEVSDPQSLNISDLPFFNYISNPCNTGGRRNSERNRTEEQRHNYSIAFYRYMVSYSTLYKRDTQRVVNESVIDDCVLLNLPHISTTPDEKELQEMGTEEALKRILSSLLLHSAHAYFLDHQYSVFKEGCLDSSTSGNTNFAREALILARKQRHMACLTQMTIEELGYSRNNTNLILNERFTNFKMCSRRAVRDCQVMLSIIHLLDVIANYSKLMLQSLQTV